MKGYGPGHPALGPVSIAVCAGEALGVRGPNGAGKSTMLALMAGVLKPDAGTVTRAPRCRTGYVPQDISLYRSLTCLENLRFWGLTAGLPRKVIEVRSRWLLEQVELTDRAGERVETLSGGMQRRLHMITALLVTPDLLLLDEPAAGADSRSAELIFSLAEKLVSLGSACVLCSHRPGDLEQVCSRIVALEKGVLTGEEEEGQ